MKEAEFTVFFSGGFLTSGDCGRHTLQELIQADAGKPLAWAPVFFWGCGKQASELKAESIAAGRTIELIDGRYVPRGVPVEDKPAKSIGAILRAKLYDDGRKLASDPSAIRDREHIHVAAKAPDFDPWKGFFTEPADMADWQDTYYPR
jgi:hypothetical protein